jgi:MmyB-like transcription regulator ligand binding domain
VLASLARVLGLNDDQRTYMYELAGAPARSRRRAPQKVKPYLRRVLDRIDAPAIVMTPTHDILAWNPLAAALMVDFGEVPERERNFMRRASRTAPASPSSSATCRSGTPSSASGGPARTWP